MVVVNTQGQEINAKIVYYGPALSGKTTNLEQIYDRMPSNSKGKMVSMKTRTDRTLFFDFLPIELGDINGYRTRMLLYTVPGQVYYNATRKLVLKGADAIVFVADSSPSKLAENIESLRNLEENLNELGLTLDTMPWVIQYNKRDLPDAAPVRTLENELNLLRVPSFEAVAMHGIGVYETFQGIAGVLFAQLSSRLAAADQPAVRKAAPAGPEPKRAAGGVETDSAVSRVVEDGLREVGPAWGQAVRGSTIPRVPGVLPQGVGAAPHRAGADPRSPGAGPYGPEADPRQSAAGAKQTPAAAKGRPAPRPPAEDPGSQAFRFVSLETAPIDESVGRVIDLEHDSTPEIPPIEREHTDREFITDPCRSNSGDDAEDISDSISTVEAVSLAEPAPSTEDECVITVPVLLSRSQTRKTIPIKLRLEVQIVNDEP